MTLDELTKYNGKNGQPAYVAVGGIIYDVSQSAMWQNGAHAESHEAGADLSLELKSAPHIAAVIERFPSVGRLEAAPSPTAPQGSKMPLIIGGFVILAIIGWFLAR